MILNGLCMTLENLQLPRKNKQWLIIFTSRARLSKITNPEEPIKINAAFILRRPEPKFSLAMPELLFVHALSIRSLILPSAPNCSRTLAES